MLNLRIRNDIIIAAGYCDFTNELKEGEIQVECLSCIIPHDISTHWQYDNEIQTLVEREVPLSEEDVAVSKMDTEQLLNHINTKLQQYIYGKYDTGTQISFNAIYSTPGTPEVAKTAILGLKTWIMNVLAYYYQKKAAVISGTTWEDLSWDLSQFDATDPKLSLSDYIS